ncbi:hypothetical protein SDC9_123595 [bioreactor metagenome]|uniref:Uncharacterized protein n=1 Tax=bioreactor metagenome TaxID=1076179 RepID=A0A645CI19_9ZZZZ
MPRIHLQALADGIQRHKEDGRVQRDQQLRERQQSQRGARMAQHGGRVEGRSSHETITSQANDG